MDCSPLAGEHFAYPRALSRRDPGRDGRGGQPGAGGFHGCRYRCIPGARPSNENAWRVLRRAPGAIPGYAHDQRVPGLPGFQFSAWFTIMAPAGTPKDIIARLNAEAKKALADPEVRKRLTEQGRHRRWQLAGGIARPDAHPTCQGTPRLPRKPASKPNELDRVVGLAPMRRYSGWWSRRPV